MDTAQLYQIFQQQPAVCTDSRKVVAGSLFFALRGDTFDGNRFAAQALEKGAAYAIVDDPALPSDDRYIRVEDSLRSLQELARHHRKQFRIPVLGITGSNGKTTTKELVKAVLDTTYPVHCTTGNFNNHIGVPLTLLAMPRSTELAIIEMGANHQGEIDFLSRIAEPTHGLITNIGKAHLEGFGGIEGVKKGKSELYRFLAETNGEALINLGERFLEELSRPVARRVFYAPASYQGTEEVAYSASCLQAEPFVQAAFQDQQGNPWMINSQLPGAYNFANILTAIAVGQHFGVPGDAIQRAIEAYLPHGNRSVVVRVGSNTLIQDAYNANPTSMRLALDNLARRPEGRKMAILGDMLELGDETEQEHQDMIDYARSLQLDAILLIGPRFGLLRFAGPVIHFPDVEAALAWLEEHPPADTCILVKGSRGLKLEGLWGRGPLASGPD